MLLIKDSTGDWEGFQQVLEARAAKPSARVLQGMDELALRSIVAGADGVLTGLTNLAPDLYARLVKSAQAGDMEEAQILQSRIESVCELFKEGFWVECLKYAVSCLGIESGHLCGRPHTLSAESKDRIRQIVETLVR